MPAPRIVLAAAVLCVQSLAFAPLSVPSHRPLNVGLFLTSEEVLAKARQATGIGSDEAEAERPKLFDESIYTDIAKAYEKLDKRFKEGPGSLTAAELRDLEAELSRIGEEMRENQHKRPPRPSSQTHEKSSSQMNEAPAFVMAPPAQTQDSNTAPEHEGPNGFDGKFGVPAGTRNTYVIEGMDEMTAEEYQIAIQESVSARQRQRRASGMVGNQTSQNYLDNLGKGK